MHFRDRNSAIFKLVPFLVVFSFNGKNSLAPQANSSLREGPILEELCSLGKETGKHKTGILGKNGRKMAVYQYTLSEKNGACI